jgi:DNA gyrase subunit A
LTKRGKFAIINTENINPIGRNAVGVVGIKLATDDCVVAARKISKDTTELVSITSNGMIKRTPIDNFTEINRGGAGKIIQKIKDNDSLASFENINNQKEVAIISNKNIIKVSLDEIPTGGNIGTRAQKLKEPEKVIGIITIDE